MPSRGQCSRPAASLPNPSVPPPVPPSAPLPIPVGPGLGRFNASDPLRYRRQIPTAAPPVSAPLREYYLPRDQSLRWFRRLPARLPRLPDFRSLPAAISITRFGSGSPFPARYCPVGLLFLKPLGTFFTMPPNGFSVNDFRDRNVIFSSSFIPFVTRQLRRSLGARAVHKTRVECPVLNCGGGFAVCATERRFGILGTRCVRWQSGRAPSAT